MTNKNQTEILGWRNTITELKTSQEWLNSRLEQAWERIRELEDRSFEIIQSEGHKGKKEAKRAYITKWNNCGSVQENREIKEQKAYLKK
jgi:hypothetical protein